MKTAILKQYGGPESLIYYTNIQKPIISNPEQVLIRITAVALSALDVEVRKGEWEKLQEIDFQQPYILGYEFAGTVENIGTAVTNVKINDEVCGLCSITKRTGACAEYVIVNEHSVIKKPNLVLDDDAAMAIGPGVFSITALHYNLKVDRNSSILICDGASPEGFVLLQYAAELGLRIFVTACSQEHVSFLEVFGNTVARVIDELQEDVAEIIMEETDGIGVDYIVETKVSSSTSLLDPIQRKRSLIKSLGAHGSWVTRSKSMQLDPDETEILNLKNGSISFIFTQAWLLSPSKQGKFMHILDTVMRSVAEGKLRPLPCTSFNLSQIREAHRLLENENSRVGRVLIKI